jgi:hypothetical protein
MTCADSAGSLQNKFDYLKILQIARYLFDWKPAWMADRRVVQGGLVTEFQLLSRSDIRRDYPIDYSDQRAAQLAGSFRLHARGAFLRLHLI